MQINAIDVDAALSKAKKLLAQEKDLSSVIEVLLMLVSALLNQITLNSKNSSKPLSSDPNRKKNTRNKSNKPAGGQKGHVGKTLKKIDDPDIVDVISVDRNHLPKGNYKEVGLKTRQVFDPNPHLESRNSAQVFRFSKCGLDLSIPFRILFFQSSFDHVHKNIKI